MTFLCAPLHVPCTAAYVALHQYCPVWQCPTQPRLPSAARLALLKPGPKFCMRHKQHGENRTRAFAWRREGLNNIDFCMLTFTYHFHFITFKNHWTSFYIKSIVHGYWLAIVSRGHNWYAWQSKISKSVNKFYIERTTTALEIGRHGRIPIGTRDRAKLANQFYIERLTILLLEDKKKLKKKFAAMQWCMLYCWRTTHIMLKCHSFIYMIFFKSLLHENSFEFNYLQGMVLINF